MKIITLSFDDGEHFDIRLTQLLRKYKLAATFYLCSGHIGIEGDCPDGRHYKKLQENEIKEAYSGFEIGSHGKDHQFTADDEQELINSIQSDINVFSEYTDKKIICCAYPGGEAKNTVVQSLKKRQPILFARATVNENSGFEPPKDQYLCYPTAHMLDNNIYELIDEFEKLGDKKLSIFHIYGHSYELEWNITDGWDRIEKLFSKLASIENSEFMTNGEAYSICFNK